MTIRHWVASVMAATMYRVERGTGGWKLVSFTPFGKVLDAVRHPILFVRYTLPHQWWLFTRRASRTILPRIPKALLYRRRRSLHSGLVQVPTRLAYILWRRAFG